VSSACGLWQHFHRLRSKRFRTKRVQSPRKGVIRAARKMGKEQKGGRKGWGRGKKGTLGRKLLFAAVRRKAAN